jgi:cellobiose-specific phosphotransferase system component IIA
VLAQDVVDRLLITKSLLGRIRFSPTARPDRVAIALAVLTAHDAAELALAAIARHLNRLPQSDKTYLMQYFPAIQAEHPEEKISGRDFFSQLNAVRIAIKHKAIFPDPQQWHRVGEVTYNYISGWCQRYFELTLDELDELALVANQGVKDLYRLAVDAYNRGQYKECLEQLALSTKTLFESNQALRNLVVGQARTEDAIRLTGFGVHANDYLAFQEFLPSVYGHALYQNDSDRWLLKWKQGEYGHPGNWTQYACEFALKTFIEVAVKIQFAEWIPGANRFEFLYQHEIIALVDDVKITNDINDTYGMPQPVVVKTLKKGESIRCRVSPSDPMIDAFMQKKPSLSITNDGMNLWNGKVLADQVHIKCVPLDSDVVREYFPDLPELEYEP